MPDANHVSPVPLASPALYWKVILSMAAPMMRSAPSTLGVRSPLEVAVLPDWSEVVASSACSSSDQAFMSSR